MSSVLETLCSAGPALQENLRRLEEAVRPTSGEGLPELRASLDEARRCLTEHLHIEEENGYLDGVRKREPRLEREVQALAGEHLRLRHSLDMLQARVAAAAHLDETICARVLEWVHSFRQHEARETAVVQNAFNQDIGAED